MTGRDLSPRGTGHANGKFSPGLAERDNRWALPSFEAQPPAAIRLKRGFHASHEAKTVTTGVGDLSQQVQELIGKPGVRQAAEQDQAALPGQHSRAIGRPEARRAFVATHRCPRLIQLALMSRLLNESAPIQILDPLVQVVTALPGTRQDCEVSVVAAVAGSGHENCPGRRRTVARGDAVFGELGG